MLNSIEIHKQNIALSSQITLKAYTKVCSTEQLDIETFMTQFNICAEDIILDKAKELVKSDMETVLVVTDKDILPNSCRNHETRIYSTHLDHIEIEIIGKVLVRNE